MPLVPESKEERQGEDTQSGKSKRSKSTWPRPIWRRISLPSPHIPHAFIHHRRSSTYLQSCFGAAISPFGSQTYPSHQTQSVLDARLQQHLPAALLSINQHKSRGRPLCCVSPTRLEQPQEDRQFILLTWLGDRLPGALGLGSTAKAPAAVVSRRTRPSQLPRRQPYGRHVCVCGR